MEYDGFVKARDNLLSESLSDLEQKHLVPENELSSINQKEINLIPQTLNKIQSPDVINDESDSLLTNFDIVPCSDSNEQKYIDSKEKCSPQFINDSVLATRDPTDEEPLILSCSTIDKPEANICLSECNDPEINNVLKNHSNDKTDLSGIDVLNDDITMDDYVPKETKSNTKQVYLHVPKHLGIEKSQEFQIFLCNLYNLTEQKILDVIKDDLTGSQSALSSLRVVKRKDGGSRGFGYLDCSNEEERTNIIKVLDGLKIGKVTIQAKRSKPREIFEENKYYLALTKDQVEVMLPNMVIDLTSNKTKSANEDLLEWHESLIKEIKDSFKNVGIIVTLVVLNPTAKKNCLGVFVSCESSSFNKNLREIAINSQTIKVVRSIPLDKNLAKPVKRDDTSLKNTGAVIVCSVDSNSSIDSVEILANISSSCNSNVLSMRYIKNKYYVLFGSFGTATRVMNVKYLKIGSSTIYFDQILPYKNSVFDNRKQEKNNKKSVRSMF